MRTRDSQRAWLVVGALALAVVAPTTAFAATSGPGLGSTPQPVGEPMARNTQFPLPPEPGFVMQLTVAHSSPTTATATWAGVQWTGDTPLTAFRVELHRVIPVPTGDPVDIVIESMSLAPEARTVAFAGLRANEPYELVVWAENSAGAGPKNELSFLQPPPAVPVAPVITNARPGERGDPLTVFVRWTATTYDGGSPLTGYEVRVRRLVNERFRLVDTFDMTPTDRYLNFVRPPGRYDFVVRAVNGVGRSPASRSEVVRAR